MTEKNQNATRTDAAAVPDERTASDHGASDRYDVIDTGPDTVVMYDRENPRAWIQADVALPTDQIR